MTALKLQNTINVDALGTLSFRSYRDIKPEKKYQILSSFNKRIMEDKEFLKMINSV